MRYHGVDLHKGSAAVSIRDEVGHEVRYVARVETASYVATLGPQDSVALESGCGSFLWAERIQRRGARCIVIDPYRFRIIRDSWHKTDRHDAGAPVEYDEILELPDAFFAKGKLYTRTAGREARFEP